MSNVSNRISGDELLYPGRKTSASPADATLVSSKPGSARAYRKTEAQSPSPAEDSFQPEPLKEEKTDPKAKVLLSNPHWLESKGEFEAKATACVDADQPAGAATRVIFEAWAEWGAGNRHDLENGEGHIQEGKASAEFILEAPIEMERRNCRSLPANTISAPNTPGPMRCWAGHWKPFRGRTSLLKA